ncbi:hypothetical protein [Saccharopolyspora sp. 5N708]|uniref:hypothetical protein n=1 Tax=Saccharopolyspora sp. 5N708 TaxID=3457424 RepID=UPI003FD05613
MIAGAVCVVGTLLQTPQRESIPHYFEKKGRGMGDLKVAAWVRIEDCSMEYAVFDDEVEFRVGGQLDGLDLVFTEQGLQTLVTHGERALRELRARQPHARG